MKLRNKKTGEIATLTLSSNGEELLIMKINEMITHSVKLSDLEEWEDYAEPKEYWCIDWTGDVNNITVLDGTDIYEKDKKEIGNYFSSREEAEKAVEKLKTWKRLKDKGFRFKNDSLDICCHTINFKIDRQFDMTDETSRDLHLLFGGEK